MPDFGGIETILDETHAALRAGNLPRLAELSEQAELALANISSCERALAERLKRKAERNERMIAAAVKGVKAARLRARELTAKGRFSTYDSGGRRDQVGLPAQGPSRRV